MAGFLIFWWSLTFFGHSPGFQWDDSTIFHYRKNRFEDVDFRNVPRLCAFLGGVVAQEVIKKTGKWLPQLSGIQRERCRNVLQLKVHTHRAVGASCRGAQRLQLKHPIFQSCDILRVCTKLRYCSDFQILMETSVGQKGGLSSPVVFRPQKQPGRAAHTIAFRGWRQLGAAWGFSGRICWASNPARWMEPPSLATDDRKCEQSWLGISSYPIYIHLPPSSTWWTPGF